jgi:uncharacterized membrane protein YccC
LRRSRPSAVTWCACWNCKSTLTGHRVRPLRDAECPYAARNPADDPANLLTIAHALYEGNPQPILANNEKLNDIVAELRQLIKEQQDDNFSETPIHGYVWLTIELARQLELLSHLICRALRK